MITARKHFRKSRKGNTCVRRHTRKKKNISIAAAVVSKGGVMNMWVERALRMAQANKFTAKGVTYTKLGQLDHEFLTDAIKSKKISAEYVGEKSNWYYYKLL